MTAFTTTSSRRARGLSGRLVLLLAPLLVLLYAVPLAAPASAAAPEFLLTVPPDSQAIGRGAGQLADPLSIVADPDSGHVYVAEEENHRISEFAAWGEFVKSWGWGVVASGPDNKPRNEIQRLSVDATAGSFKLSLDFRESCFYLRKEDPNTICGISETGPITFDASASSVQAVLLALPAFESGDVLVSGPAGGPWTIEYAGHYSDFDMPLPQVVNSTLSGGAASATTESLQKGANAEVCLPANGDVCQPGQSAQANSAGPGQIDDPWGMAVDSAGNIYVRESFVAPQTSVRVQKFDSAGNFLLMFGGGVNKTTGANVCTKVNLEAGQECDRGAAGSGPGEFADNGRGGGLAYNPLTGTILVGDLGRIEEFNSDGTFKGEIPFTGSLEAFKGKQVIDVAVDSVGDIYFSVEGLNDVYKIAPGGEPLAPGLPGSSSFAIENPYNVAVDSLGDVYAIGSLGGKTNVYEFNATGEKLLPSKAEEESGELFPSPQGAELLGIATNLCVGSEAPGDLYLTYYNPGSGNQSYFNIFGTPPIGCEAPPSHPPLISAQYVTSAGSDFAQLGAQINPHFFSDTTYYLEYGTGKCSEGGCDYRAPLADAQLTSKVVNKVLTTASIALTGLQPATTYHYRFVANSGGGGPVYGIDPDGQAGPGQASQAEGGEGTFRTFTPPGPAAPCPANEALRAGAALPDCRAYELVSPLEKLGGSPGLLPSTMSFFEVNQSSSDGQRFTYSAMSAFADPESAPYISQYLSTRDPSTGWSTESISPPRSTRVLEVTASLNNEFRAFSPDLCQAWLAHNSDSTLAPGAIAGFPNLYRRDNCQSTSSYEALTTVRPPEMDPSQYELYPLGFSADGAEAVFLSNDRLSPDAPDLPFEGTGSQRTRSEFFLYVNGPGGLRYACYLPNGKPISIACSAGMFAEQPDGRSSAVQGALSADGSRLYWTAYEGKPPVAPTGMSGTIYLRINPDQPQSKVSAGKCTEPEDACTVPVSGSVTPEKSEFWGASRDGSKAFFRVAQGPAAGDLYEFELATKTSTLIAEGVENPMAVSGDGSRVYFASTKVLGQGESEGAKAGANNLYLYEAGVGFSFIMRLTGADLSGDEGRPGAVQAVPTERSSVLSADGALATFVSTASPTPTGYDNTDAVSGQPDQEVYRYDAESHQLRCISCNPTGARPLGADTRSYGAWVVAQLPKQHAALVAPHPLSSDGKRLFFESYEALVPRDTDGTWDVYEWEAAGTGSCTESTSTYKPDTGGCVELISSGSSAEPSRFLDADPSGENVFIGTFASLVAADYGLPDVYDARVNGGFPEAPGLPAACEGEACQAPFTPPGDETPASSVFQGNGDIVAAAGAKAAPKAKTPTVAQKLARALKACHARHGKARRRCEAKARKRFGRARGSRKRTHISSRRAGR